MDSIYSVGYLQMPDDMPDFESHTLVLLDGNIGSEHSASEFVTPMDVSNILLRDSVLVPSIVYDVNRTRIELNSRISQLVTSTGVIQQGERIIAKGETVTKDKALIIASLEQENDKIFRENYHPWGRYAGTADTVHHRLRGPVYVLKNTRHSYWKTTAASAVAVLCCWYRRPRPLVSSQSPELVLIVPPCIVPIMVRIFFDMGGAVCGVTTIAILTAWRPQPL